MSNSLATVHPELIVEWSDRNLPLTPDSVTFGSNKKVSRNHPRMSLHDRAAQFAPFAALTGHDAAIKETARLTDERLELSDEVIMKLNDQLNMIRDNIGTEQEVIITYFVPDDKKAGGAYITHSGMVKKIDEFERNLIMQDEIVIPIEQISEIQGEMFKGLYE